MTNRRWREGRRNFTEEQKKSLIYEHKGDKEKGIGPLDPNSFIF